MTSSAFGQACPNRTTLEGLQENLLAAETAFSELDVESFSRSLEDLALKLPCVRDAIPADVAARYHRVLGVSLYANGEEIKAFHALQAARTLDQEYQFPEGMFPAGHALVVQFNNLDPKERHKGRVLAPRALNVHFDGKQTRKRPVGRATLLQLSTEENMFRSTQFLHPTDPMPNYEARARLRKPLLIGVSITAALATLFYGSALASRAEFNKQDPRYSLDDLERLQKRTNTLVGVSATLGGLALGGGITVVIVGDR